MTPVRINRRDRRVQTKLPSDPHIPRRKSRISTCGPIAGKRPYPMVCQALTELGQFCATPSEPGWLRRGRIDFKDFRAIPLA